MELIIEMIGGNCPVQAEGTICGKPFYFRARGEHWSMGIGGDPIVAPDWEATCSWGDGPFAAGWMPEDEARRLIEWCAGEYSRNAVSAVVEAPPAPVLDPAAISDQANAERLLEPKFEPEANT